MINIHATLVDIEGKGVLIRGKSGSGKSDLALRLIYEAKAKLVADDRVDIYYDRGIIKGKSPKELCGMLEIRGVGISVFDEISSDICISLIVDLVDDRDKIERMPDKLFEKLLEVKIPKIDIFPFECSTIYKIIQKISGKII